MAETEINKRLKEERAADLRRMTGLATSNKNGEVAEGVSLPPPIKDLLGGPQEEIVRVWARQSRQHTIQICDKNGCYYPLTPQRDPSRDNEPRVVYADEEVDGEKIRIKQGIVGLCSWGGKDHGEQIILPPPPKEE